MTLPASLERIAARARTLEERLRLSAGTPAGADALLPWAAAFSAGDRAALRRRLAWDGLDEEAVLRALGGEGDGGEPGPLPEWARFVGEALSRAGDTEARAGVLVEAFAEAARARFAACEDVLAPPARAAFDAHLDETLARIAAPALAGAEPGIGMEALLERLPVLARLLARAALDDVAARGELASRLRADAAALADTFGARLPVVAAAPGLSDRHAGGRSVARLTFASGAEVVYKPRPVDAEAAFASLLSVAGSLGAPVPRAPALLVRAGYGWAEAVRAAALASADEARAWFFRAGGLLCVSWLAGMKDLHVENVIAAADGPVVVDAEMTLQPRRGDEAGTGPLAGARGLLDRSVAACGLVGGLEIAADGRRRDVGGLTSGAGGHANLPLLDGRRLTARDEADALVEGFAAAYKALAARRAEVAAALEALAAVPVRVLLRESAQYARLLAALLAPRHLADGAERSASIEVLYRVFRDAPARPRLWPLAAEERAALENMDLPVFRVAAGTRAMRSAAGEEIPEAFAASGIEAVRARLAAMGPADLAAQADVLRALLAPAPEGAAEDAVERAPEMFVPKDDALVAAASRIADELTMSAVPGPGGSLTWLAAGHVGAFGERGAAYALYGGAAGIALFLAAAARVTGRADLARAAEGAAVPLADALAAPDLTALAAGAPVGGVAGIGSVSLALAAAGRLVGDARAQALARRAAALVTPESLAGAGADVAEGAAGAALALLALREAAGDDDGDLLARAALCCRRLLLGRETPAPGVAAWADADGLFQAGFAHGTAGIALALARVGAETGDEELLAAAREARANDARLFDSTRGNWPVVVRIDGGERRLFMNAWCHGAPGIALSRLGLLEAAGPDDALAADLDAALRTAGADGLLSTDHLCCGNAGRIEALVCAGERLAAEPLADRARELAGAMLARAVRAGSFRFRRPPAGADGASPGFFRGLAGVGYGLLRLAAPSQVPSVALLEAVGYRAAPQAAEHPRAERIAALTAAEARGFTKMTFPAYRHLLSLAPARRHTDMGVMPLVTPVAVGAFRGGEPAGLALAEVSEGSAEAEALSIFVAPGHRCEGLGTRLAAALEEALAARGVARVNAVYMTGQPTEAAFERLLGKAGWEAPKPRMLAARFSLAMAREAAWYGRYPLGEGLTVFPWADLSDEERRALRASQEERGWIKPDLVPWRHDHYGFEPVSSLGVRWHGELVGWVINHALSESLVRFTCSFIRKDLGRRGKLVPAFSESIRRLSERTSYSECSLTVPLQHAGMAGFLRRWCAPVCSWIGETRGTGKQLS